MINQTEEESTKLKGKYKCCNIGCMNEGTKACGKCRAVGYCSRECQTNDWKRHKKEHCGLPYCKENWEPSFNDMFSFIYNNQNDKLQGDLINSVYEKSEFLFGNTPAHSFMDPNLLKKDEIEIAMLGCGDLRHFLLTVNSIPLDYKGKVKILLDDFNPRIMMRNLVVLYLLLKKKKEALELVIHLWYSAFLRKEDLTEIKDTISSLINSDISNIELRENDFHLSVVDFPSSVKEELLLSYNSEIPYHKGVAMRKNKIFSEARHNVMQRFIKTQQTIHRNPMVHFMKHGILFPMGQDVCSFMIPNSFIFNMRLKAYVMSDMDGPHEGWNFSEVLNSEKNTKVPPNDVFGNIFFHIRTVLENFVERISCLKLQVELRCCDARILSKELFQKGRKFDVIETSNLADLTHIGHNNLLLTWSPLVKSKGTIVTLLMNWLNTNDPRLYRSALKDVNINKLLTFDTSMFWDIQRKMDLSPLFLEFLTDQKTFEVAKKLGLIFLKKSTIVPFRDGTKVGDEINKAPYLDNDLISKFLSNNYMHYCEWKKN